MYKFLFLCIEVPIILKLRVFVYIILIFWWTFWIQLYILMTWRLWCNLLNSYNNCTYVDISCLRAVWDFVNWIQLWMHNFLEAFVQNTNQSPSSCTVQKLPLWDTYIMCTGNGQQLFSHSNKLWLLLIKSLTSWSL